MDEEKSSGRVTNRGGAGITTPSDPFPFAYITGWRIPSEVLPLEWRNVDLEAGEVRLDAHTTKNGEGRRVREARRKSARLLLPLRRSVPLSRELACLRG